MDCFKVSLRLRSRLIRHLNIIPVGVGLAQRTANILEATLHDTDHFTARSEACCDGARGRSTARAFHFFFLRVGIGAPCITTGFAKRTLGSMQLGLKYAPVPQRLPCCSWRNDDFARGRSRQPYSRPLSTFLRVISRILLSRQRVCARFLVTSAWLYTYECFVVDMLQRYYRRIRLNLVKVYNAIHSFNRAWNYIDLAMKCNELWVQNSDMFITN